MITIIVVMVINHDDAVAYTVRHGRGEHLQLARRDAGHERA